MKADRQSACSFLEERHRERDEGFIPFTEDSGRRKLSYGDRRQVHGHLGRERGAVAGKTTPKGWMGLFALLIVVIVSRV